jgi:hypothetical protein
MQKAGDEPNATAKMGRLLWAAPQSRIEFIYTSIFEGVPTISDARFIEG